VWSLPRTSALVSIRLVPEETSPCRQLASCREVAVARDALPATAENEYYWSDLIGLSVLNTEQQILGKVKELLETGVNDVLVVQGERERLIPFVPQVVLEVDVAAGTIRVEWGLDW